MLRNVAIACSLVSAAGCSIFMRSVEKPTVAVEGVAVTSASLVAGVDGEVKLDVTNPNAVGVPLSGIDWQLSVAGGQAVTGHVALSQTIPARGVAPVTASLHIDARDAFDVARKVATGARDYQLDARLHFSTALGEITVDVHKDGALADGLALR